MVDVEIVDGGEVQFNSLVLHVFLECRHEIDFFFVSSVGGGSGLSGDARRWAKQKSRRYSFTPEE